MPEGHTLHRLAKLHRKRFAGGQVRVTSPQGRFADGAALIDGRVLTRAEAWGKHLLHHYDSGVTVHIHLGLYGKFYDSAVPMAAPVGEVRMRLIGAGSSGEPTGTDLRGPNACEILTPPEVDVLTARLGPDPLRRDADPDRAWSRIHRSRRTIGAMLMDQKVIAGVGNVYRAEVLFRQGISPDRPGAELSYEEWQAIWADLVDLMKVGVRHGRIVVVRPEDDHGAPAYAKDKPRTYVYRRVGDPCRLCGTTVLHSVLDARNLFWCPTCQPH
ncbi:Fpg/Nei family DNA glycosylase [Nocardia seriolae]|uniref:Endonuclease 8 1 n=1 Tax=Nocardia seriolae TaxID=37332 RepID=A0A0B8NG08_9NOCA|nr:DNA-formamidopyrimidine glycosylase family protein [Nocardia seriolae]APB00955.1 Endonuclease 8 [Nocardia seriolae]MTJ65497.1 Fpg/Nei family DNA glycosylase [Nocardia seriolae]MTJ75739.1 Fpg/Nei family DNA glycosylase [Nocardia seriolae]MTJ90377.1 Fpg/Nei family DNA glycosylase [Nocardia seriolae]MTK34340.1 Fpg/Nei family DNA glycosylase [Nocardia seriolae]